MIMKGHTKILLALFILSVLIRLYFAFQPQGFAGDEAYFHLRQVDHIKSTGRPLINDGLSYGGRTHFFLPLFDYLLAIFAMLSTTGLAAKVIPNIFAAFLVFPVYYLSMRITGSRKASLLAALISVMIPIYLIDTLNSVSPNSLFIPVFFLMLYCFMCLDKDSKHVNGFLLLLFLSLFIEPFVAVLVPAFALYFIICKAEKRRIKKGHSEMMLFTSLAAVWILFMIFKRAFIAHGTLILRGNIPAAIMDQHFAQIDILTAISQIGIFPLLLGLWVIYSNAFNYRRRSVFLFTSLCLVVLSLLLLRLVELDTGLVFLGVILAVLSSFAFSRFFDYIKTTKLSRHSDTFLIIAVLAIILTSATSSFAFIRGSLDDAFSAEEIEVMEWVKENTEENSTIAATLEEGHLITSIAERKNMFDSRFMLIEDAEMRVNDNRKIFTSLYKIPAIRLLNKYDIDYILLSDRARLRYGMAELKYASKDCFDKIKVNSTFVYRSKCTI